MKLTIVYLLLCILGEFDFTWAWFWALTIINILLHIILKYIEESKK